MTKMKIPLMYGLPITLGVMAWVIITHWLIPNTQSAVHEYGGPFFFNLLQFTMIYLGLKAKEREYGDKQDFKKGVKTGVAISFVYAFSAALFFAVLVSIVGTRWLPGEPASVNRPSLTLLLQAFGGIFIGSLLLGLLYSTVISFFLAKRRSEES